MIKKPYLRPTTNVVEVKIAQLLSGSQFHVDSNVSVSSAGLDEDEELIYGKGEAKNAWYYSW